MQRRTVIFATPIDRKTCYLWYLDYWATEPLPADQGDGSTGVFGFTGQP